MDHPRRTRAAVIIGTIVCASHLALARVDVKVAFDKAFDFKPVRTWGWNPKYRGDVKMARTPTDDPEAIRARAEPIIVEAATAAFKERGLQEAASNPDVVVTYYLLLTTSMDAQTAGQFLPAVPFWGLPPFAPATTSLKVMNQGSLVLDIGAKENVVWRGLADAHLKMDADDAKREKTLRDAVRDLIRRFPPR
jgi:hypothetical protein